jgi:hypothetical protein
MKTSELSGAALDWAVAKCEGVNEETFRLFYEPTEPTDYDAHGFPEFNYSTIWSQGGPIIEREKIAIDWDHDCWNADVYDSSYGGYSSGPTALVAAMRNYVASKLGAEIEIPEELK